MYVFYIKQLKHLVIIPTYNEKENISQIVDAVLALPDMDVLVVDDNSPDGTGDIVEQIKSNKPPNRVHLIRRAGKLGLGTAYIAGFQYAIQHRYDYISEMDADFSHNPKDLIRLRQACIDGADISIGSRYVKGGGIANWPASRVFISRGGSLYVQILTFMPVKDPTAGFICYKREVLEAINLDKIGFTGYAFQIEMKYVAWKLGYKITEVPITFKDRELGVSKMSGGIIKEAVVGVLKLVYRNIPRYYGHQELSAANS